MPVPSTPTAAWRRAYLLIALVAAALAGPARIAGAQQGAVSAAAHRADSTCVACRDFYRFANQAWLDTATIPPSRGEWGAWGQNESRVLGQLRDILDSESRARPLGLFYAGCMDSVRADRAGIEPLRASLASIATIASERDVMRVLGALHRDGVSAVFRVASDVDRTGDLRYAATIDLTGFPLGRTDYVASDSAAVRRREAYTNHIARTFVLAGAPSEVATADARRVVALEGALAQAGMSGQESADQSVQDMFRHLSRAELAARTPGVDWDAYFRARHAAMPATFIVADPAGVVAAARLVAEHDVKEWRAYLRWRVLSDASAYLSAPFADENFEYSRSSSGASAQAPRWQRCIRETSADLPEVLGRAYAARTLTAASKEQIQQMVSDIRVVLVERLTRVPWLTEPTRKLALEKARTFGVKIGYPDRWHDISALRIADAPFVTQRAQARRFESDRLMARIGKAPNRAEWDHHGQYAFVPQSPTAWANWDEIIFPAGYLQAPLFDPAADPAANFGALGVVIGHEMTHLFTADGGDIQPGGRVGHWWTAEDSARFAIVQKRIVDQYNRYTLLDSLTHVNGNFTLGENLADIGGVELAFAALQRENGKRHLTPEAAAASAREFFLSYAHFRASKSRPEYARRQLASDPHAPPQFRVIGPFSNLAGFARTFGCRAGDPMAAADAERVEVW